MSNDSVGSDVGNENTGRMAKKRSMHKSTKTPQGKNAPKGCAFCGVTEDNESKYGKLFRKYGLTVHHFCMLFSSALDQRGSHDSDGILGFLKADIEKELRRGAKLKCHYCKKNGATVGCSLRKCAKKFHLPCGMKHDTLQQFFGSFCAFCPDHRPKQEMPTSDRLSFHGTANTTCPICLCAIEARSSNNTLRTPCCKNSWFHRTCVQEQALNAGYFFKCPLCNNKEIFQMEMLTYGIYIPEQDASWEREVNAFQDLLYRHDHCDSAACKCPDGRQFSQDSGKWEIILCRLCGSQGCHIACGRLPFYKPSWECVECRAILDSLKDTKTKKRKGKRKADDFRKTSSTDSCTDSQASTSTSPSSQVAGVKRTRVVGPGDHIVEKIRFYQLELKNICRLAQDKAQCNSVDSKVEDTPSASTSIADISQTTVASSSDGDSSLAKSRTAIFYDSDSDAEVDIISCDDSKVSVENEAIKSTVDISCHAQVAPDSDVDIEVINDLDLRLLPNDFPSPSVSKKDDDESSGTVVLSQLSRSIPDTVIPCVSEDEIVKDDSVVKPVRPLSSAVLDFECQAKSDVEICISLQSQSTCTVLKESDTNDERSVTECENELGREQIDICITPKKEENKDSVKILPARLSDIFVTPTKGEKAEETVSSNPCQRTVEPKSFDNDTNSRLCDTKIPKSNLGGSLSEVQLLCADDDVLLIDNENSVPDNDCEIGGIIAKGKACNAGDVDVPKENTNANKKQSISSAKKKKKKKKKWSIQSLMTSPFKKVHKRKKKCKYQLLNWDHTLQSLESADPNNSDSVCDISFTSLSISDGKCDTENEVGIV